MRCLKAPRAVALLPLLAWCLTALLACASAAPSATAELNAVAKLLLNAEWQGPGKPWKWPPAERGASYTWVLSPEGRARGVTYLGTAARLRRALDKLRSGQNITISTIGGSITAGQGAVDGHGWSQWFENHLLDLHGNLVTVSNGAFPGTISAYMSVCLNVHVPKTADIVFVEYNQNDPAVSTPLMTSPARKNYERMLRKILVMPNRPAVVLMHSYAWMHFAHPFRGCFYSTAEREFNELAHYYDLPMLSVKACCHELMVDGVPGFRVEQTRNNDREGLQDIAFNWDPVHPDGRTGARVMAELALHLVQSGLGGLEQRPLSQAEHEVAEAPIRKPMIPNNWQSLHDSCFIGNHFTQIVTKQEGFMWLNEAKPTAAKPKWGYIAKEVGATLELTINTMATVAPGQGLAHGLKAAVDQAAGGAAPAASGRNESKVVVEVAYLQSYEKMGRADVQCLSGCECQTTLLDGHAKSKGSQLHLLSVQVTQSHACVMQVKVREDSAVPGNHKVKVAGVIVSERAALGENTVAWDANGIEYVNDISFRAKDGSSFDIKNHVR